jgi:hypothetical protein
MSSEPRQRTPGRVKPITTVDLAVRSTFYSSTACVAWGFVLALAATFMVVAGSAANNDGAANGDLQLLGLVVGALGAPLLLVGLIAAGVRLGLSDHAADQQRRLD